jgi:hypothetical protein
MSTAIGRFRNQPTAALLKSNSRVESGSVSSSSTAPRRTVPDSAAPLNADGQLPRAAAGDGHHRAALAVVGQRNAARRTPEQGTLWHTAALFVRAQAGGCLLHGLSATKPMDSHFAPHSCQFVHQRHKEHPEQTLTRAEAWRPCACSLQHRELIAQGNKFQQGVRGLAEPRPHCRKPSKNPSHHKL